MVLPFSSKTSLTEIIEPAFFIAGVVMSEQKDIRWVQRLHNYKKALHQLGQGVDLSSERDLSDLEKEGVIQRFEYTQELAWKVIKDFYNYLGEGSIQGSRDAFQMAFQRGLIKNGVALMNSSKSRNQTVHTYNQETANEIFQGIINSYYGAFREIEEALEEEKKTRKL
jgi:nucleotidyltransferase substrate binding protein (TIGR01987 family)